MSIGAAPDLWQGKISGGSGGEFPDAKVGTPKALAMSQPYLDGPVVYSTPWFQVLTKQSAGSDQTYYAIQSCDFAVIVAQDQQGRLLLVRQFRPVVGIFTLELPAGHIEPGETPEQAARKELCEETGYEAGTLELLVTLSPSTARFTNRMWIFHAPAVRVAANPLHPREAGLECILHSGGVEALLTNPELMAAGTWAALLASLAQGKIKL